MANITEKIKEALAVFKATGSDDTNKKVRPTGYETQGYGYSDSMSGKKKEYLKEMKSWVGSCVNVIADEVATIQIKLYKYNTKEGVEEVPKHRILEDLYRVNDYTTKFGLFWLTTAYLKLTGESPWLVERDSGGVKAIYFLRPDKIVPIVGGDKLISGYEYTIGDHDKVTLPLESVIFLKVPDPANPFRGLGTVQMAARTIDIDNYSEEWNKTFYENSAHPDSILSVNVDQLQEDQLDRLKKSIKEQYEGIKKSHKTMVLFGDMKWNKLGFSQKDMDFLESSKFTRDKILGMFRVPKAIIAQTDGVNFAAAKAAQYIFSKWTIKPEMEKLVQQLNEFLLPMYPGTEQMFLSYVNPVPQDSETESKVQERLVKAGIMTINEARNIQELPDMEGGDSIYIPMNLIPIGTSTKPEKGMIVKELKSKQEKYNGLDPRKIVNCGDRIRQMRARSKTYFEVEDLKDEIWDKVKKGLQHEVKFGKGRKVEPKKVKEKEKTPDRILTHEQKEGFWVIKDALTDKYFPKIKELMAKIFQAQGKGVISKLSKYKAFKLDPTTVYNGVKLNEPQEINTTIKITLPELEKLFAEAADEAYKLVGVDMEMDTSREEIQKILKFDARKFSTEVTKVTNANLKNKITVGIAQGQSVDELKESIGKLFNEAEQYRADRIARSETVRYNTSASEQAFKDSKVVSKKEWFVNPGACEFCLPMDGKTVDLGEPFYKEGDTAQGADGGEMVLEYDTVQHPPLHVNCRCEIVPVFK